MPKLFLEAVDLCTKLAAKEMENNPFGLKLGLNVDNYSTFFFINCCKLMFFNCFIFSPHRAINY